MSQDLETIKALGAERVHAETHISVSNLLAIFNKEFGKIHPVQFLGFISILEREYGADLYELKAEFAEYRDAHAEEEPERTIVPPSFDVPKKQQPKWLYAVAAVAALLWLFYQFGSSEKPSRSPAVTQQETPAEQPMERTAVEQAETPLEEAALQPDETVAEQVPEAEPAEAMGTEENASEMALAGEPEPVVIHDTLSIMPTLKLWVGMINLDTRERQQMVTSDTIAVDTNHPWLFLFGHGHLKIEHNGEVTELSSKDRLRFIYKEGEMRQITPSEFRSYNGGREW